MEIKCLTLGLIGVNCYLLSTDRAAVVIDPGFPSAEIIDFLKNSADKQRLILLTHAHFDHIGAADELRKLTGTEIAIGKGDSKALFDTHKNLSDKFHARLTPFSADIELCDNENLRVGDIEFTVLETAGHTPGGVCYLCEDKLFSGDTLFYESVGRTDFFDGDSEALEKSVRRLYMLNDNLEVYPGHGPKTTILHEKRNNPFIRG